MWSSFEYGLIGGFFTVVEMERSHRIASLEYVGIKWIFLTASVSIMSLFLELFIRASGPPKYLQLHLLTVCTRWIQKYKNTVKPRNMDQV